MKRNEGRVCQINETGKHLIFVGMRDSTATNGIAYKVKLRNLWLMANMRHFQE